MPSATPAPTPVAPLLRIVVGTAGHIDHGKTRLVEALTGIDCDRWAEEKARGITIDLGFAHLTSDGLQMGFVDVPGHDRFIHNALAGLGGIRIMLLVVAADEGVMPQTREHLAICSLLGIPAGLVVLTKKDLVTPDLLELAELEVSEALEGTPFASSQIVSVSSLTGEGIDQLKRELAGLAREHAVERDSGLPARLPIDRAFHLLGLGVVVTGTLASGVVGVGTTLEVLPTGKAVRVRSVQVHGVARKEAVAGERTSLQLSGISLEDLARGMQLVAPGSLETTSVLCGRFTLLPDSPRPIRRSTPVRVHHFSAEVLGTLRPLEPRELEPGESGLVELRLAEPLVAARGDRFIVRRPSPQTTLGGGTILDPGWRRRRGPGLAGALGAVRGDESETTRFWVESAGEKGLDGPSLARRLGQGVDTATWKLEELAREQTLVEATDLPGRARLWIARSTLDRIASRARRVLREYFQKDAFARGMPRAEAVGRIVPSAPPSLIAFYLAGLERQKVLVVEGDLVTLPGRRVELSAAVAAAAETIRKILEEARLSPPSPDELQTSLGLAPPTFDAAVRFLQQSKILARLPNGVLIARETVERVAQDLASTGWERFSVPQFKERFGLTRKLAIPLLEHLDSIGFTRRAGEERIVAKGMKTGG